MKFTLKMETEDEVVVAATFSEVFLPDILVQVRHFLLGCGFHLEGDLIVEEEMGEGIE